MGRDGGRDGGLAGAGDATKDENLHDGPLHGMKRRASLWPTFGAAFPVNDNPSSTLAIYHAPEDAQGEKFTFHFIYAAASTSGSATPSSVFPMPPH
jgi:hypothetical protein